MSHTHSKTHIKFCGITSPADALLAQAAGAWALGVNLWHQSPRYCTPEEALAIRHSVQIPVVGVMVNPSRDYLTERVRTLDLKWVQLHGNESPDFLTWARETTGVRIIKAHSVATAQDLQDVDLWPADVNLLDSPSEYRGGTGESWNWSLLKYYNSDRPLLLAGGLNPDNVSQAIDHAHPWGVDVASGVELEPGVKAPELLELFAQRSGVSHHQNS